MTGYVNWGLSGNDKGHYQKGKSCMLPLLLQSRLVSGVTLITEGRRDSLLTGNIYFLISLSQIPSLIYKRFGPIREVKLRESLAG